MPDEPTEGDDDVDVHLDRPVQVVEEPPSLQPGSGLLPQLSHELSSLRQRIDVVHEDVAGLEARLQSLGSAIGDVEVALGDRLAEYADTVVQLGRGLTSNVTTYREGNERTVSELRRALADSEELLRAVLTRVDDLAVAMGELGSEPPVDERAALGADEVQTIVRDAIGTLDVRTDIGKLANDLAALGDRVTTQLASNATVQPLTGGVDAAMHTELLTALETIRTELQGLRRAQSPTPKKTADVERERVLVGELAAMRDEIAQLKRRIAVRAKSTAIDDEQIATIVERVKAAIDLRLDDADVERVAVAVAHRFSEAFEVVLEEPAPSPSPAQPPSAPPAAPAPAAARPAKKKPASKTAGSRRR